MYFFKMAAKCRKHDSYCINRKSVSLCEFNYSFSSSGYCYKHCILYVYLRNNFGYTLYKMAANNGVNVYRVCIYNTLC